MRYLILMCFLFFLINGIKASDCGKAYDKVQVFIHADKRSDETSWSLKNYYTGELYDTAHGDKGDTICIPANTCLKFTIYDAYGDGICCGQGDGYYQVKVNGKEVAHGGQFARQEGTVINCRQGLYCNSPIAAHMGVQVAPFRDAWYTFITDSTGLWEISTCGLGNTCDTRLYTYARCQGIIYFDNNVGTQLYSDNSADCDSLQAKIDGFIKKGDTLLIRVGDKDINCTGTIRWELKYKGPIKGCMDSSACNYKPQATISDGSCIYPPNAICPLPDLEVDEPEVYRTMHLDTAFASTNDCLLAEGCLRKAGLRYVIKFSTRIRNIGEADFVLGDATGDPSLFIIDPCHGHWHYKEFIQYSLSNTANQTVLVAHKDGFCISDMECPKGVIGPYGCNYMGITPGCSDVYDATVPCQWVDITGLDTGVYKLSVVANWRKEADKYGRIEHRFDNNTATVWFRLDMDIKGKPFITKMPHCPELKEDVNHDGAVNEADVDSFLSLIANEEVKNSPCLDLNGDGNINVADVVSLNNCLRHKSGKLRYPKEGVDYCSFPGLTNDMNDTVSFEIGNINYGQRYFEINIKNPFHKILGFEFKISRIYVDSIKYLKPQGNLTIRFSGNGHVVGLAKEEESVPVNIKQTPFLRVYCMRIHSFDFRKVISLINENYEWMILSNRTISLNIDE